MALAVPEEAELPPAAIGTGIAASLMFTVSVFDTFNVKEHVGLRAPEGVATGYKSEPFALPLTRPVALPITDVGTKKEEPDNPLYLYRAMRNVEGFPEVGDAGLAQLGVRPSDVNQKGPDDIISPNDLLGMSVTYSKAEDTPFQSLNKTIFKINVLDLPKYGLSWVPKPNDPTGGLIVPGFEMSVDEFRNRVHSSVLSGSKN